MSEAAVAQQAWSVPQQLFASLPWYDLPEIRDNNDALWDAIAAALRDQGLADVPEALDRTLPYGFDWNGRCLFTQTCGYPIFTTSRGHFRVLGIPVYSADGCDGHLHRSFIIVRKGSRFGSLEDLRDGVFAVNEPDSNSGMNLPRHLFAPLNREGRFFRARIVSGSHVASAELVRDGAADAAAIDCVTFALLQRHRPDAIAELSIIAHSAATPAPPFVTSSRTETATFEALRRALMAVMRDSRYAALRDELFLQDVSLVSEDAYAVVFELEREAQRLGYPILA